MASDQDTYLPHYQNSYALVIGINAYPDCPLDFAKNDAEVVAKTFINQFQFPEKNVTILTDKDATREKIFSSFMNFANSELDPDDRLVIFFAGHGITRRGNRGEIGYLVPVDGNIDDLSTLIRWDDLTRNADLIRAKHVLFIMDACYGGIAITRSPRQGGMRFAKDMLQRYSRQVITAGKADEPVSDGNGPRQGHSIFTGHLLDALQGKAQTVEGIITANSVMGYVYQNVSNDQYSRQTPHFGFLEGDGDFIFQLPTLKELNSEQTYDTDVLISNPITEVRSSELKNLDTLSENIKEYLSDPKYRIKLDDTVNVAIRDALNKTKEENFPIEQMIQDLSTLPARLKRYEQACGPLIKLVILLSRWADEQQLASLKKIVSRIPDNIVSGSGSVVLLSMRWYPLLLLEYAGGISAISSNDYKNLYALLTTKVRGQISAMESQEIIIPTIDNILELDRFELFKRIPGHERHYTARSEYLFKILQPYLEDELFLGVSYESLFDRFEVFWALVYMDLTYEEKGYPWAPPGRFAWKHKGHRSDDPYSAILKEANVEQSNWAPLRAGFFRGDYERFKLISQEYSKMMAGIHWH